MTEVLRRDPAIICEWVPEQFDPPEQCHGLSVFVVERSDGASPVAALPETDHTRGEACEYHVADVIDWMLGGDGKLHAIVTPRWWDDGEACTDCSGDGCYPDKTACTSCLGSGMLPASTISTPACPECNDTGMVWVETCTCGAGPFSDCGMHERYCGAEPCSNGCPVVTTKTEA